MEMDPAPDAPSSLPTPTAENDLQPFFVLHKASPPRKSAAKTRRRIDLSPKTSDSSTEENDDNLRLETFNSLWSKTESIIKDVLKNLNANVFDEIDKWVHESFNAIRACRKLDCFSATSPYPTLNSASIAAAGASRQIFTGLLFTRGDNFISKFAENMEFIDDILTFADLGEHLRSNGCYVANLTSLDFSTKSGVGGCLKTLLRQFLMVGIDAPDMSILASWYTEQENNENPLVVIIDDVERCCASVLADFIIMLSDLMSLGQLGERCFMRTEKEFREFTLGTPAERMDAVIESVLLRRESFSIGKQVSTFLRNCFLRHDGTLTLFIRSLKGFDGESILLRDIVLKRALNLPSLQRFCQPSAKLVDWASGLSELKRLRTLWSSTVMCLFEAGKYQKISLLDLYCEILEHDRRYSGASDHTQLAKDKIVSSHNNHFHGCLQKEGYVVRAFQIVRDLTAVELCKLLNRWELLTRGIKEVQTTGNYRSVKFVGADCEVTRSEVNSKLLASAEMTPVFSNSFC
ncbi:UNVERIFIED_CONTAM: Origin of replication complex subunit [Sesamum radiatum]|uniref:Origin of replication complex subunit n=1 Tax=Sesamum radiatum TaxID=300843 RepID=A0AAW2R4D0_SESRA